MNMRLATKDICLSFGGLVVSSDISIELEHGARTALIGPNGAGKTTLVNLISGALKPTSGSIYLDGSSVTHLSQAARARKGIIRTFQINRLFKDMTVADNLRTAILQREKQGMRLHQARMHRDNLEEEVTQQLAALDILRSKDRIVSTMSLGEQRLVEISLALALNPRVLLLDEPAAGVPESESGIILDAVNKLPKDLAVLLIEHDMDLVFKFATRIVVLATGAVLAQGTPGEVATNDAVKDVYFGRGAQHGH